MQNKSKLKHTVKMLSQFFPLSLLMLSASAAILPRIDGVKILSASSSGPGCPNGSTRQTLSSDGEVLLIGYSAFQAYSGNSVPAGEASKDCNLNIQFSHPSGYQFRVAESTYRGYATLDAGVKAPISSSYRFTNTDGGPHARTEVQPAGVLNGVYRGTGKSAENSVFSSCNPDNAGLEVTGRLSLTRPASSMDSEFGLDDQEIRLVWRKC